MGISGCTEKCPPIYLFTFYVFKQLKSWERGHLYLKLDIILVKNHIIRVVFQDQAMYARTSFRGAKMCKIGKKGVFWSY